MTVDVGAHDTVILEKYYEYFNVFFIHVVPTGFFTK